MSFIPSDSCPQLVAASATSTGCVRATNEDRYLIDSINGWFAIADGIGGLPYGERASECAIRHLVREIANPESDRRKLTEIVSSCHQAVRQLGAFLAPRTGIGTTLTILHFTARTSPQSALMAHIGDSVAYLHPARIHSLVRLSTDHTIEVPPISIVGPNSYTFQAPPRLDRYLGQVSPPDCDIRLIPLGPNDRLILCSDGVTRALDETEISTLSAAQPSAAELARALVQIADLRGGLDNATALVIDVPLAQATNF